MAGGPGRDSGDRLEVFPLIRVHPSAIVFKASDRPVVQSVELRSEKEPFRVLGMTGQSLAEAFEPSSVASVHHEIQLKLASPRGETSGHEEIQITTDCARQPRITLGLIILPGGKESGVPQ
jgi:hypothetical protein